MCLAMFNPLEGSASFWMETEEEWVNGEGVGGDGRKEQEERGKENYGQYVK